MYIVTDGVLQETRARNPVRFPSPYTYENLHHPLISTPPTDIAERHRTAACGCSRSSRTRTSRTRSPAGTGGKPTPSSLRWRSRACARIGRWLCLGFSLFSPPFFLFPFFFGCLALALLKASVAPHLPPDSCAA